MDGRDGIFEKDEYLRTVFECVLDGLFVIDLQGGYMDVNPAGCRMFGYTREEFLKSGITLLLFPDDAAAHSPFPLPSGERIKEFVFVPEYRMRKKHGTEIWVEMTINPLRLGGKDYCLVVKRDITERRRTEKAIAEAGAEFERKVEERTAGLIRLNKALEAEMRERGKAESERRRNIDLLRAVMYHSMALIYLKDSQGRYIFVNRLFERLFNVKNEDVEGKTPYDFFPKDMADKFRENDRKVLDAGEPMEFEEEAVHPDGTVHTYLSIKFPIPGVTGAVCGISTDITERKKAEETLKKNETFLKEAEALAKIGHWEVDVANDKAYWSETLYDICGIRPEDSTMTLEKFLSVVHPDDRGLVQTTIDGALYNNKSYDIDYRIVRPDGGVRVLHVKAEVSSAGGLPVRMFGTAQDITGRKKMEEELLKFQKLESLGILAGGIAHDFNNILQGILGNISIAKTYIDEWDKVFGILADMEKAAFRAKGLARKLLTFSMGGEPVKGAVRLGELVRESASMALRGFNAGCNVTSQQGLWAVEADEGQIGQALSNIIQNSGQATKAGGAVEISVENVDAGEDSGRLKKGRYVMITIQDSGCGISHDNLLKIFDPFFTTKDNAAGLGLSVAYSIVKKHGGHIDVSSEAGIGTTARIYLPASARAQESWPKAAEKAVGRRMRVLVMDDEEIVRDVVGEMLMILGYTAEFARSGREALDMYKKAMEQGNPFAVVIMDLTVPGGMGGQEAVKKLLEIDPRAKAVVSSGYSSDQVMSDYRSYGFKGVISKPYRVGDFRKALEAALASE
ncbi:MAG: PAS domain S-box protein [Deltaproteobacteria bacterium]|nr:PAS domain S-box protein [Deltaproteobacteria bacterium]